MSRKKPARTYWTLVFGDVDFSNRLWATRQEARDYKKETGFLKSRIAKVEIREV